MRVLSNAFGARAVRASIFIAVLLSVAAPTNGQNVISEDQARRFATQAAAKAAGDERKFEREFRDLARTVLPQYDRSSVTVHYSTALSIYLVGPLSMFHSAATTAVRKLEPVDKVEWFDGVALVVSPTQIDSPNIEKVVVTRGGQPVEPEVNGLEQVELETRMGAKAKIGAGVIKFSAEAFAPNAEVVVTAIPKSGSNVVKALKDGDLKKLR